MTEIPDQLIHTGLKIPSELSLEDLRVSGEQEVMGSWTRTLQQETERESFNLIHHEHFFLKKAFGCRLCQCKRFQPGRHNIRSCDHCTHGWVTHAVSQSVVCPGQVEIVQSDGVFDISSLVLYGTDALPVRMKILLDRLFSVLTHAQVLKIIHTFGWTLRDYIRGYMTQSSSGNVLDHWRIMSPEDELITLQQFLRFGETKSIVELMIKEQQGAGETSDMCKELQSRDLEYLSDVFLKPFMGSSSFQASAALHLPTQLLNKPTHDKSSPVRGECSEFPLDEKQVSHHKNPGSLKVDSSIPDSSSAAGERRHRSSSGKGRVSCSTCDKTFYDKGTLKIHFNAVHLKIKHRCTIEGCNMMFSSLRSRNRHSANPNPRLHTPQHTSHPPNPRLPLIRSSEPRMHASIPQPNTQTWGTFKVFVTQSIPKSSPPVLPSHRTGPRVTSITACNGNCRGRPVENNVNDVTVMMSKKKPRKSSTPLKFKRQGRHDNCPNDDDKHVTLLSTEAANDFHSNTHNIRYSPSEDEHHTQQTPQDSYHSDGGPEERNVPILQVKEEVGPQRSSS